MSNLPKGDTMLLPKPDNTTRGYCQNINGFQLVDPQGGTFNVANEHLKSIESDVTGFVESNLDTTQHSVMAKLYKAVQNHSDHSRLQASSSSIKASSEYKPGGTISILRDNPVSRLKEMGSDPLGRWSYIH